ncbi:hypothetical protein KC19_1G232000 [Ceratodon purpureus]|uniref:Uncharacterized protein n=1 Tax=Ceratodon purpureus TaxID=3225 RepID=A0A8T0J8E8_CERPU|nr:hypothetical protein KC19_1G232000 [Ceratodon purpureus]
MPFSCLHCSGVTSLSHGRFIPNLDNISTALGSKWRHRVQYHLVDYKKLSSSPRNLSEWQAEDRPIFTFQGAKWKGTVGKVAKWVFRTCMVLMALFAVFYGATCLYSCCLGLDLLGKIWRTLGGCGALRALLSYFVNLEQATVVDDDADAAAPLIAAA